MVDLAIAYRIYPGVSKVPAAFADDKLKLSRMCLKSFKSALGGLRVKIWALLDGCPAAYEEMFRNEFAPEELEVITLSGLGNAKTFCLQLDLLTKQTDAELLYFAEDDYFYFPDALVRMVEFARNNEDVDFITPYDHPGNYDAALGCVNTERHLITPYGDRHWRTASATCLTFLAKRGSLISTRAVFETYRRKNDDGSIWLALTQKAGLLNFRVHMRSSANMKLLLKAWFWGYKQILFGRSRKLWNPIPTLATHMESTCLAPIFDWSSEFQRHKTSSSVDASHQVESTES